MLKELASRFRQGNRTVAFPDAPPNLPERFRGLPELDPSRCPSGCAGCEKICPTGALGVEGPSPSLDLGRCLFCGSCQDACPAGTVTFGRDHRLSARRREDLILNGQPWTPAAPLDRDLRNLLGRSFRIRQVSAGGCNACEADANVLSTVVFDLGRFGIQFVASPRHADALLVTGPVSGNMRLALEKTYRALPAPRLVIASGACAISGGPWAGHPEVEGGASAVVPVDLFVPGCPPHPITLLDGLLRLLGRHPESSASRG